MIICLEDRESIDENAFVSNYENFKITINDGRIYLYKHSMYVYYHVYEVECIVK